MPRQETLGTNQTPFEEDDIVFPARILLDLLLCPLCGGCFKDAVTIKDCLHTFCNSCITLTLHNVVEPSCPTCGNRIPGIWQDGLQKDSTVQQLVDKLFPHLALDDAADAAEFRKVLELSPRKENETEKIKDESFIESNPTPEIITEKWEMAGKMDAPMVPDGPAIFIALKIAEIFENDFKQWWIKLSGKMPWGVLVRYVAWRLQKDENEIELFALGQKTFASHSIEFTLRSKRIDLTSWVAVDVRPRRDVV